MLNRIRNIGIFMLCFLCAMPSFAAGAQKTAAYQNNAHGFHLQYPADWKSKEGIMGSLVAFISTVEPAGKPHFNANIVVEDVSAYPGLTLEKYTTVSLTQLRRNFTNFQLTGNRQYTLSNLPARLLTYRCKQGGYDFVILQVLTLHNNKAYVLIAGTEENLFPQYEAAARSMFDSFTFD